MGLTIHYKGELKNSFDLKSLIDTVKDVAKAEKWDYFIFEQQFETTVFLKLLIKKIFLG
jgi:hypothetical protein